MAPRNFLLESSIFQSNSSSDPLFFLENPHLTDFATELHDSGCRRSEHQNCYLMAIHGQLNCNE